MKCNSDDPRITAYVFDELDTGDRAEFEAELQASADLRQQVQATRATIERVRVEFSDNEPLHLSDQQRAVVQSELSVSELDTDASSTTILAPQATGAPKSKRSKWRLLAEIGAAAAVLFIIATALILPATQRAREAARATSARNEARQQYLSSLEQGSALGSSTDGDESLFEMRYSLERAKTKSAEEAERILRKLTSAVEPTGSTPVSRESKVTFNDLFAKSPPGGEARESGQQQGRVGVQAQGQASTVASSFDRTATLWDVSSTPVLGRSDDGLPQISEFNLDPADRGRGPGEGGDKYDVIVENDFLRVTDSPLSTFSIDVDTASYSKVRQYLNEHQQLPRPDAVRIEELVNYFPYHYEPPAGEDPFAAYIEAATCPWQPAHQLVRIGIKGQEIAHDERPASNLVFLLDVSGSMDQPNKLPLVKRGMQLLTRQLSENDRVAIVVYAGAAGLVLDSTTGDQQPAILNALERLQAGGSTNGGAGIHLAYQLALDHFIQGGTNRVILCTDGDFNVGTTGTDELVRIVENHAKSGVFLSVLGFGMGNHNDAMLEQISGKGNGNYAFVDTDNEAKKVLVEQLAATLITIAKDVKIQVEFNPAKVAAYRLIGYENRLLAAQDFNDDTKDAGEIGAGHTVTALYELVPAGEEVPAAAPPVDELKYQTRIEPTEAAESGELLTLKLRYKQPDGDTSKLLECPLQETDRAFSKADRDYQFAAAVASFGMLLRNSKYKGDATYASVLEIATPAAADDPSGYRQEFLELVRKAGRLAGEGL